MLFLTFFLAFYQQILFSFIFLLFQIVCNLLSIVNLVPYNLYIFITSLIAFNRNTFVDLYIHLFFTSNYVLFDLFLCLDFYYYDIILPFTSRFKKKLSSLIILYQPLPYIFLFDYSQLRKKIKDFNIFIFTKKYDMDITKLFHATAISRQHLLIHTDKKQISQIERTQLQSIKCKLVQTGSPRALALTEKQHEVLVSIRAAYRPINEHRKP